MRKPVLIALAALFLSSAPAMNADASTTDSAASGEKYVAAASLVDIGGFSLSTKLYAPPALETYPVVLLIAGSGNESVIDSVYMQILAGAFAARGVGVLAYDKRGTGQSGGEYTGGDFAALGADAAALVAYLNGLPQVDGVGLWGISQAGWIIPYAVRNARDAAFAIIVSPAGVNPHEQVSYFLYRQALSWGLTETEAADAERMHRAIALYYAGRSSHASAQRIVDRYRDARWFHGVITHPYWDEMTPDGKILTPQQLRTALRERPGAFEIYRERSSFADYAPVYRALRRLPTLVLHGGDDELVPVDRAQAALRKALRNAGAKPHDFHVFDGASHDIQTPDGYVVAAYLDMITDWARERFNATGAQR